MTNKMNVNLVLGLFLISTILSVRCQELKADNHGDKQVNNTTVVLPGLLGTHKKVVVCYANVSAVNRKGQGNFNIGKDLDCTLCTHVIFASSELDSSGKITPIDGLNIQWPLKLKTRCPHVKILISVRQAPGSMTFSSVAADPNLRQELNKSVISFFLDYQSKFDGIDLDLNLNASDPSPSVKEDIVMLVKNVRQSLDSDKILTAALSKDVTVIDKTYNLPKLSEQLNFLHVKCFDYYTALDEKTGPNAPLYGSNHLKSVVATIEHIKTHGAPTNKLVLGVPMFGRSYILKEEKTNQVVPFGLATSGYGLSGPYTSELGFLGYMEVCEELKTENSSWSINWDDVTKTSYAQNGQKWISYEDERSVIKKAQYAVEENLAGVMIWTVDLDDFRGDCSKKDSGTTLNFPLLRKVHETMAKAVIDGPHDSSSVDDGMGSFVLTIGLVATILLCMLLALVLVCVRSRFPPACPLFV